MKDVLITRRISDAAEQTLAEAGLSVDVGTNEPMPRERLHASVPGRRGVICLLHDRVDDQVLVAAGPQCRIFANYAVGYDNIDLEAATRRGILVTNTPDVLTDATADLAFSLLLAAARRLIEGDHLMRSGRWSGWSPLQLLGRDPTESILGIIGAGRIGTTVAQRSTGFRMRILYVDQRPSTEIERFGGTRVDMPTLLRESDFVTLHVNLTPETHHLIGAEQLALMKPTACLINTSRGPVVDERALVEALSSGRLGSAGLDVYEDEPALAPGLRELDNVVLSPHLGSATEQTRARMARLAARNIIAALDGRRPETLVNLDAWKRD
ncbi:MAG: D-glycerate dehydrogenase [Phycisphaerales bacterium]|nr:MAG: D-glycerate dehydrogenase [Phycisphaerales bacterium]